MKQTNVIPEWYCTLSPSIPEAVNEEIWKLALFLEGKYLKAIQRGRIGKYESVDIARDTIKYFKENGYFKKAVQ